MNEIRKSSQFKKDFKRIKNDLTKVEATNEDGILDIKLPFKPEEKEESKKITIL